MGFAAIRAVCTELLSGFLGNINRAAKREGLHLFQGRGHQLPPQSEKAVARGDPILVSGDPPHAESPDGAKKVTGHPEGAVRTLWPQDGG